MEQTALQPRDWLVAASVVLACALTYLGAAHAPMPWSPIGVGQVEGERSPMQSDRSDADMGSPRTP